MRVRSLAWRLAAVALAVPAAAAADTPAPSSGGGLGDAASKFKTAGGIAFGQGAAGRSLEAIVGAVVQSFLALLGIIFLGLTIFGGYKWMMARGNEQEVEKAKETLKSAVIGLAVVLAAYAITTFVVTALIGATTAAPTSS